MDIKKLGIQVKTTMQGAQFSLLLANLSTDSAYVVTMKVSNRLL